MKLQSVTIHLDPFALRKTKIAYNIGLSECNKVEFKLMLQYAYYILGEGAGILLVRSYQ